MTSEYWLPCFRIYKQVTLKTTITKRYFIPSTIYYNYELTSQNKSYTFSFPRLNHLHSVWLDVILITDNKKILNLILSVCVIWIPEEETWHGLIQRNIIQPEFYLSTRGRQSTSYLAKLESYTYIMCMTQRLLKHCIIKKYKTFLIAAWYLFVWQIILLLMLYYLILHNQKSSASIMTWKIIKMCWHYCFLVLKKALLVNKHICQKGTLFG